MRRGRLRLRQHYGCHNVEFWQKVCHWQYIVSRLSDRSNFMKFRLSAFLLLGISVFWLASSSDAYGIELFRGAFFGGDGAVIADGCGCGAMPACGCARVKHCKPKCCKPKRCKPKCCRSKCRPAKCGCAAAPKCGCAARAKCGCAARAKCGCGWKSHRCCKPRRTKCCKPRCKPCRSRCGCSMDGGYIIEDGKGIPGGSDVPAPPAPPAA